MHDRNGESVKGDHSGVEVYGSVREFDMRHDCGWQEWSKSMIREGAES